MKNAINWFEIPVSDFERSVKFYSAIFDCEIPRMQMGGYQMGLFPCDNPAVGGAVVYGNGYIPSAEGALLYLNGGEDLTAVLNRVEPAGGKIAVRKTLITNEIGFYAVFMDSEGNRVALHSAK